MKYKLFQMLALISILSNSVYSQGYWIKYSGLGGSGYSAFGFVGESEILVSSSTGLFRTTNNGLTWNNISFGIEGFEERNAIWHFAISSQKILYVATTQGLYKSADYGLSWKKLTGYWDGVRKIYIGSNDEIYTTSENVLRFSNDNGITWTTHTLPMSISAFKILSNGNILISGGSYLMVSTDRGNSWNNIFETSDGKIISFDTNNNGLFLVGQDISNLSSARCVYKSTDNGTTWNKSTTGLGANVLVQTILIHSNGNIYLGTQSDGIYLSSNQGSSWVQSSFGINTNNIRIIQKDYYGKIYAGSDDYQVFRSNDGLNWAMINNSLPNSRISLLSPTAIQIDKNGNLLVALNSKMGVYKSTDKGESWSSVSNGLPINRSDIVSEIGINSKNYFFIGTQEGMYRSIDGGGNWNKLGTGSNFFEMNVFNLAFNSRDEIFISTRDGVYKSIDDGLTWSKKNNGINVNFIWDIKIKSNDEIFVTTEYDKVFRSRDNGESWEDISNGLPLYSNNSKRLKLAFHSNGNIYLSSTAGIFFSTDNGNNWNLLGLKDKPLSYIMITNDNRIFVSGSNIPGEVYYSNNNGLTWILSNHGIFNANTFGFIFTQTNEVYICTNYGVYKFIDGQYTDVKPRNELPSNYSIFQNYPNPFNPSTTIKFSIPNSQFVTLKIYDLLGREISTLVNEEKLPGNYEVKFIGSNLSSGVYFYRLQAGSFSDTKKFILMK